MLCEKEESSTATQTTQGQHICVLPSNFHLHVQSFFQIEARSVDHFKKLNKGMENKIMELQRKLDHMVSAKGW